MLSSFPFELVFLPLFCESQRQCRHMDPGVRKRVTAVQPTADVVLLRVSGPELHYLKCLKNCKHLGWDPILGLSTHCRVFSIIGLCPVNAVSKYCGNHPPLPYTHYQMSPKWKGSDASFSWGAPCNDKDSCQLSFTLFYLDYKSILEEPTSILLYSPSKLPQYSGLLWSAVTCSTYRLPQDPENYVAA